MRKSILLVAGMLLLAVPGQARAAFQIDWNALGSGSVPLAQSYTNVGGSGVTASYALTGDTATLIAGTPAIDNVLTGGVPGNYLHLQTDAPNTSSSVTLTITFNASVAGVNFDILDVDKSNTNAWQDRVIVTGNGGSLLPTLTTNSANTPINATTVDGTADAGNASSAGTVSVSFAGGVTSFSIVFTSGSLSAGNPASHGIALGDVNFTTITPAPATAVAAALGVPAFGLIGALRRRFNRSK